MATNTYVSLFTEDVVSPVGTITFSPIPQTYTDLVLVVSGVPSTNTAGQRIRLNGDSSSLYSTTLINGDGSVRSVATNNNNAFDGMNYQQAVSTNYNSITYFFNYASTTDFKTTLTRYNGAPLETTTSANTYRSNNAITSISVLMVNGNFAVGTSVSLFGIQGEGMSYATGGLITSDADYYYHTFTASGTFTTSQALTCDVLSVGGGGGGGWNNAGGGGGGEVDILTGLSINSGVSKTVTIGGGGALATSTSSAGANGVTTTFASDTSSLGGGGGGTGDASSANQAGQTGGSGGGGALSSLGGSASGSNTNIGGAGYASGAGGGQYAGGGGGGATSAGGNANLGTLTSGAGGQGYALANIFSGLTLSGITHFGSGGSGGVFNGTRALGGTNAGDGAQDSGSDLQPTTPTANAGGGGGGGSYIGVNSRQGSNGASGIVIVRYAK